VQERPGPPQSEAGASAVVRGRSRPGTPLLDEHPTGAVVEAGRRERTRRVPARGSRSARPVDRARCERMRRSLLNPASCSTPRGGLRRVNWRWPRPPRPAHQDRTPGRPVGAVLRYATSWVRLHSAYLAACRAGVVACADLSAPHARRPSGSKPGSASRANTRKR